MRTWRHREVNWLTQSHRAFKHWHLRLKSSLSDSLNHTLLRLGVHHKHPHADTLWRHLSCGRQTTLEPESPKPIPAGASPNRTWSEVTHCFLVADPSSRNFLGLAAERVANWFSFHWLLGDFMAKTMLPPPPGPTHNPHPYTITNGKCLMKFPSVAGAGLKVKQTLAHLLFTITCRGRC